MNLQVTNLQKEIENEEEEEHIQPTDTTINAEVKVTKICLNLFKADNNLSFTKEQCFMRDKRRFSVQPRFSISNEVISRIQYQRF